MTAARFPRVELTGDYLTIYTSGATVEATLNKDAKQALLWDLLSDPAIAKLAAKWHEKGMIRK